MVRDFDRERPGLLRLLGVVLNISVIDLFWLRVGVH